MKTPMMLIYGIILLTYGAASSQGIVVVNNDSLNVDLMWGGAFLIFGLFMGGLAIKASRRSNP